jgi:hypothetical protein
MDSKQYTDNVIQLFNAVAHGYDNPATRLPGAMLSKTELNITRMALTNVDLFEVDARRLGFKSRYFDVVLCPDPN